MNAKRNGGVRKGKLPPLYQRIFTSRSEWPDKVNFEKESHIAIHEPNALVTNLSDGVGSHRDRAEP